VNSCCSSAATSYSLRGRLDWKMLKGGRTEEEGALSASLGIFSRLSTHVRSLRGFARSSLGNISIAVMEDANNYVLYLCVGHYRDS
jgi:hypothetical protein